MARSGHELFYLDDSGALTAVTVRASGPTFTVGSPARVFNTRYVEPNPARHYDVSPDGQRFLMIKKQRGRRSERNTGKHDRGPALVRGAATACADERKVKRSKLRPTHDVPNQRDRMTQN
jgi:hypothetical protein